MDGSNRKHFCDELLTLLQDMSRPALVWQAFKVNIYKLTGSTNRHPAQIMEGPLNNLPVTLYDEVRRKI